MAPVEETAGPVAATAPGASGLSTGLILVFLLAVGALYLGREIFLPFALAILLSFLLAPLVTILRRYHLPRVPAIIATVLIAFFVLLGILAMVGGQVVTFADNLPKYQYTIQDKIRSLKSSAPGGGIFERALVVFQTLGREIAVTDESASAAQTGSLAPSKAPVPVRIEQPSQPLTIVQHVVGGLVGPIGTTAIVIVLVIFILFEREDLRDRFIRLAGRDVHRTTQALNEAARRVSRYLLMQLAVNAIYGSFIGLGLFIIGIPNSILWGVLATLLRFIPYLGPVIAAFFPLALAFAVDPGWSKLLWTLALILTMELISNNFIEPRFYGSSTGLSSIAIIISAIFWTVLWGPIGLVLATPLTVCLVVIGRYVPQLEFLGLLLGSEPPLAPEEKFYQRLVAGNPEEALELAEAYTAEKPLLQFYDEVCLPALRLAEIDRQQGNLEPDSGKTVAEVALTVVRELGEAKREREDAPTKDTIKTRTPTWEASPVLCIAGRGEHDSVVSSMLVQLLDQRGVAAGSLPASTLAPDAIGKLELAGVEVLVLSFLHPQPQLYARYACRRLRRRAPHVKLLVGCWNLPSASEPLETVAEGMGADAIEVRIGNAIARIERFGCGKIGAEMTVPAIPTNEAARLDALHSSGLLEARSGGHLDRIAKKIAEAFETPIALVTLVDESCQLWKGAVGLPDNLQASRQAPRETSICGHVVAADETLVVEDTARDPRFANNPFLREHNIRFYAGAPLRTAQGYVIGSLCVIDTRPRKLTGRDVKFLELIADELMTDIEGRDRDPDTSRREPTLIGVTQMEVSVGAGDARATP
jgi:predicted PurR-regulated permease PerM